MTGSFRSWSLLAILAVLCSTTAQTAQAQAAHDKRRISVAPFDYSAVRTGVREAFGADEDIGQGIQVMLARRIAAQGKVTVVEWPKPQSNDAEDAQSGTETRAGKKRGPDALLYGDVLVFHREVKKRKAVPQVESPEDEANGYVPLSVVEPKEDEPFLVSIKYKLVDAQTFEVIGTGEVSGQTLRAVTGFGRFKALLAGKPAPIDTTSPSFVESIPGEAIYDCVNKLTAALDEQLAKIKTPKIDVSARVAYVDGTSVTINAGSELGVFSGDRFEVKHLITEVRDPASHKILDYIMEKVGEMVVTNVKGKIATGTFTGNGHPQISDEARKM